MGGSGGPAEIGERLFEPIRCEGARAS